MEVEKEMLTIRFGERSMTFDLKDTDKLTITRITQGNDYDTDYPEVEETDSILFCELRKVILGDFSSSIKRALKFQTTNELKRRSQLFKEIESLAKKNRELNNKLEKYKSKIDVLKELVKK